MVAVDELVLGSAHDSRVWVFQVQLYFEGPCEGTGLLEHDGEPYIIILYRRVHDKRLQSDGATETTTNGWRINLCSKRARHHSDWKGHPRHDLKRGKSYANARRTTKKAH